MINQEVEVFEGFFLICKIEVYWLGVSVFFGIVRFRGRCGFLIKCSEIFCSNFVVRRCYFDFKRSIVEVFVFQLSGVERGLLFNWNNIFGSSVFQQFFLVRFLYKLVIYWTSQVSIIVFGYQVFAFIYLFFVFFINLILMFYIFLVIYLLFLCLRRDREI